jgi:hypothetical protein
LKDSAGGLYSHGIYLANAGSKNTTIRNNTIVRDPNRPKNSGCLHVNGDSSVGGDGIISGLLIENNLFIGCYANAISMDGVQSSTIRNNLVAGGGKHAVRGYRIDGAQGPQKLLIYNNTFIVPGEVAGWAVKLTEDMGEHVIFNNILLNAGKTGGGLCVSNGNFYSEYNITVDRMSLDGEKSVITLSNWKAQSGQDAHTVLGSPSALFVDPEHQDYHLKDGSFAIDAGSVSFHALNAVASDMDGNARPQGAGIDIGAFEKGIPGMGSVPAAK